MRAEWLPERRTLRIADWEPGPRPLPSLTGEDRGCITPPISSPRKDQNAKFQVWFLPNVYSFHTIIHSNHRKLSHRKSGLSAVSRCLHSFFRPISFLTLLRLQPGSWLPISHVSCSPSSKHEH